MPHTLWGESRFGADIHSSRVPLKIMPVNNNMPKKTGNFKVILDTLTGNKEQNFKYRKYFKEF